MKEPSNHPEDTCERCGGKNPTWWAKNDLFNEINGSPNGIICPSCFEKMAGEKGIIVNFEAVKMNNK